MSTGEALQRLIEQAYAAALDDHLWPAWAEGMIDFLGGRGGNLVVVNAAAGAVERNMFLRADPEATRLYLEEEIWRYDPQIPHVMGLDRPRVYTDVDHVRPDDPAAARHADFLAAHTGWAHYLTGVVRIGGGSTSAFAGLSVHRRKGSGPTPAEEARKFNALLPQMGHAMTLAFRQSELLTDSYWQGYTTFAGEPALLLDDKGRVLRATAAAEHLVRRCDGFDIRAGYPHAAAPADHARLTAVIARATEKATPAAGAARLRRPTGRPPLIVTVYPIPRITRLVAPAEAAAVLVIVDPSLRRLRQASLWGEAFGLTRRETELAALLMAGHSVESASATLGRSPATMRLHLRHLFEKTGVSRQADLVAILTRIG